MIYLIAGLALFLGIHCIRIFADGFRTRQLASMGERRWKLIYTIISLAGFVLIIWGYGQARQTPIQLYTPPSWAHPVVAVLMLVSLILIVAANVPGNHFKHKIGHPMLAGTKVWAFAHLLSNGTLADVALFGGFLAWAVLCFTSMRRRDRATGKTYRPGTIAGDLVTVAIGGAVWAVFTFWAHAWLFRVKPL